MREIERIQNNSIHYRLSDVNESYNKVYRIALRKHREWTLEITFHSLRFLYTLETSSKWPMLCLLHLPASFALRSTHWDGRMTLITGFTYGSKLDWPVWIEQEAFKLVPKCRFFLSFLAVTRWLIVDELTAGAVVLNVFLFSAASVTVTSTRFSVFLIR